MGRVQLMHRFALYVRCSYLHPSSSRFLPEVSIFSNLFLPRKVSAPEYALVKKGVVVSCFIRV